MKKITFIFLIILVYFTFTQNVLGQIIPPKKATTSLNMDFFSIHTEKKHANTLTEMFHKVKVQRPKPSDNMPIFSPKGKFFLKIYEVEPDIDDKINVFPLEKSNYFWRTVG